MHRVKELGSQIAIGTGFAVFTLEEVRYVELVNERLQTWQIAELPERYGVNPFEASATFQAEQRAAGWPWTTPDEPEPVEPAPYVPPPPSPRIETPKEARQRLRREKRTRPKATPGSGHTPLFEGF